jgi:capsular exopolysaccharide synthesis family protein
MEFDPMEAVLRHKEGIDVIPSNKMLTGTDLSLITVENREKVLKEYLELLEDNYDYIIIDCPPLGLVIDAAIIGGQSDGAIIVVEAGKTKYRLVQNVKDQLENSGVSVLGVVLNKVERKNQKGYYNKYYGSQKYEGYYGHNEETKNA